MTKKATPVRCFRCGRLLEQGCRVLVPYTAAFVRGELQPFCYDCFEIFCAGVGV